jgi:hypothetical protein
MTELPQRMDNPPPGTFWLETGACFGLVSNKEQWLFALSLLKHVRDPLDMKIATWVHPSQIMVGDYPSFGLGREHLEGKKTLRDHAREHNLTWLLET